MHATRAGDVAMDTEAVDARLIAWNERWAGLTRWLCPTAGTGAQAELLRASALSAIPRLLQAVSLLHEPTRGPKRSRGAFSRPRYGLPRRGATVTRIGYGGPPLPCSARHLALGDRRRESQCEYSVARLTRYRGPAEAARTRRATDPRRTAPDPGSLRGAQLARGPRRQRGGSNRSGATTPGHQS